MAVVQPKYAYELDEKANELTYKVKSARRGRMFLFVPACVFLLLGAAYGSLGFLFDAGPGRGSGAGQFKTLFFGCMITLFLLGWWATRLKTYRVVFDAKSITVKDKTYLLEHVAQIGWSGSGGYGAAGYGLAGAAHQQLALVNHLTSGVIYIVYGSEKLPIITGLHPEKVELICDQIYGFLERFGWKFR